ncbi:MAG: hypothetical protein COC15_04415 [Legionellales bacterium]|nr:MAG: hypothetical protein COC15_04415 [Legionellales bacterium]
MRIIEITLVLAISALIAGYAIPSFTNSRTKQEALFTMAQIEQAVQYAKTITTPDTHIYLCASSDNKTCSPFPARYFIMTTKTKKLLLTYPKLQYGLLQFKPSDKHNNILSITSKITSTPGTFKYTPNNNNVQLQRELVTNNNARVYIDKS